MIVRSEKKRQIVTKTLDILDARRVWLDAKTKVNASNITRSDVPGSFKQDFVSFEKFWKDYQMIAKNHLTSSTAAFSPKNVVETKMHAKRDVEMIEINRNALEHQAVLGMINSFHKMMRSALSTQQGG